MLKKINSVVDILLIFLIIVSTNSMYVNMDTDYKLKIYITFFVLLSFSLKVVLYSVRRKIFNVLLLLLGIYYLVIGSIFLINNSDFSVGSMLYYFINFPFLIIILIIVNQNGVLLSFLNYFINITFILGIISIFFWFFGSYLNLISPTSYVINNWSGGAVVPNYYGLYFETQQINILDSYIIRNSGVFSEAPMWSLILSLALIFQELYLKNNIHKSIAISMIILSTFSTTGIYIIGLLVLYKLIVQVKGWIRYFGLIIVPILIYGLSVIWENKAETSSANIRFDDYRAGFLAWKDNIILGSGFTNGIRAIEGYMDTTIRVNLGYSNSLFVILAQGGIVLFILYLLPMIVILVKRKYTYDMKFFVILLIVILGTTIFVDTYIFAFIIGFMYSIVLIGELDEKNNRRI